MEFDLPGLFNGIIEGVIELWFGFHGDVSLCVDVLE